MGKVGDLLCVNGNINTKKLWLVFVCHCKTFYNPPLNWYNFAQHTFTLMQFHILYAGKFSLPFNFRPFRPCCEWPNLRLDEFEFLSSNTTVSGQIQDRENPFATEEGQT